MVICFSFTCQNRDDTRGSWSVQPPRLALEVPASLDDAGASPLEPMPEELTFAGLKLLSHARGKGKLANKGALARGPPKGLRDGLATLDIVSVASDVADAATALAGLILVYLGAVAVRYETLDPKDQSSARDVYRRHARRAFRGIVIALVAAIAALTAKSLKSEPYATMIAAVAVLALLMSFFIAVMAAYWILRSLD